MGSGYSTFTGPYPDTASVGTTTPPPSYAVAPSTSSTPQSPDIPVTDTEMDVTTTALRIPKTTAWRHKKTARKNEQRGNEGLHLHKMWSYAFDGHSQWRRKRYVRTALGQIPWEQWLAACREEAKAKAAAKQQ